MKLAALVVAVLASTACKGRQEPKPREQAGSNARVVEGTGSAKPPLAGTYDAIARPEFNRWAVRLNLPVYWIADTNEDKRVDANEVAALLFYPTSGLWVAGGKLTPEFDAAYQDIVAASKAPKPEENDPDARRRALVGLDLDQGRATLLHSDFSTLAAADKQFVDHMMTVAKQIDALYELMKGATALAAKLPADPASRSLFRRNRGAQCVAPATEKDPACSAIPGAPKPIFDIYPAELQSDPAFCAKLQARPDAKTLLEAHFAVVRGTGDQLKSVPYTEAYKEQMTAIANELGAAADSIKDPTEAALVAYLRAAAKSFTTNDWIPADEAWAKMTVDNSKWYVRVGPDEVYWEPCAQKGGLHLAFARINQRSKEWQSKLVPVQQQMEDAIAVRAGAPYKARKVTFHLPDFIEIVVNAGDDRVPLGGTIGQSLPNWGPVANEGRGRTVAMTNLYADPDSVSARKSQAESLLDAASMKSYAATSETGLLGTILHEAMHNLGPAHDYTVANQSAGQRFGGPLASVMEELKAQTGALFLTEFLRAKGVISDEVAATSYADNIVWAFGHISQGMYTGAKEPKTYGNLAAIQIGILIEKGALTWDPKAKAANGADVGAFTIHGGKLVPVAEEMMKLVGGIKARGDKAAAEALIKKYVDSSAVVPHAVITERFLRFPKGNFVYAVTM
jgi:hypothetical protein